MILVLNVAVLFNLLERRRAVQGPAEAAAAQPAM